MVSDLANFAPSREYGKNKGTPGRYTRQVQIVALRAGNRYLQLPSQQPETGFSVYGDFTPKL